MFCYDPALRQTHMYINVYANPNRDCPFPLQNTIPMLLAQLYKLNNVQLIQGDFNLHCSYWDDESNKNPSLAWDMIRTLHNFQLSLVNDESILTFYHHSN